MSSTNSNRSTGNNSGAQSGTKSGSTQKSDYAIVKEGGFSDGRNFMESHGLRMGEPADDAEAKAILDAYRNVDEQ